MHHRRHAGEYGGSTRMGIMSTDEKGASWTLGEAQQPKSNLASMAFNISYLSVLRST